MCGINGGWLEGGINPRVIEDSLQAMRYRGPDDVGTYLDGRVFVGNCRLSIIDLSGGHQPMFNEDHTVAVVLNGEIYNYQECRRDLISKGHTLRTQSDTEVLVHLYEEHGTGMCEHLRGMFAFALWDSRTEVLFIARDRFGKKPLYYTVTRRGLLLASELKALRKLAADCGEVWSVRDQSVYDYLSLGFVPQPHTIYDQVFALPPGSWMKFDGRNPEIRQYWDVAYEPKVTLSFADAAARIRELLADAVRLRLRSDVPLGVFLSGGMDSAVVACEAARILGESLQTFTVAMGQADLDESELAASTARHLGVRHRVLRLEVTPVEELMGLVRLYDQPYADESAIPSLAISRIARQHVKVILNGDGGDELFAGYRRYGPARYGRYLSVVPRIFGNGIGRLLEKRFGPNVRHTAAGRAWRVLQALNLPSGERYLAWTSDLMRDIDKRGVWRGSPVEATENWIGLKPANGLSPLDTFMSADRQTILLSALLVKMDLATMAASLEARSPLLDHVLAEFAATLPDDYKIRRGMTKAVLREAYKDELPPQVIRGPKRGFDPPLLAWMHNEFRPIVQDTLGSASPRIGSYLSREFVNELVTGSALQNRNWAGIIYSLLMLELWLREFS